MAKKSMFGGDTPSRAQKDRNSLKPPQAKPLSATSSDTSLDTASTSSSTPEVALPLSSSSRHTRDITPVNHPDAGQGSSSTSTTPRAIKADAVQDEEEPLFDISIVNAIYTTGARTTPPSQTPQKQERPKPGLKKTMTTAEFEALRHKEDMFSSGGNVRTDDDSEDEYGSDGDDPDVQAQKQRIERAKQHQKDVQFAIYRQQQRKAVGNQSTTLPPGLPRASQSTPNFTFGAPSVAGASQSSSEDDDTPLALLQAHGFPSSKNPPNPQFRAQSYIAPPRPVSGANAASSRPQSAVKLPPFARRLPEDPYLSTSDLVNSVNRQSLGMNQLGAPSNYAGSVRDVNPIMSGPPGGLIQVIAEEEQRKSMRRGSPNYNGQYGSNQQHMMPHQPQPHQMAMGMGGQNPASVYANEGMSGFAPPNHAQSNAFFDQNAFNNQVLAIIQQQQAVMMQQYGQMNQVNMGYTNQMGPTPASLKGFGYDSAFPPSGTGHMRQTGIGQMQGMPMSGLPLPQNRPMSMASHNGSRPQFSQSRTMSMAAGPRPQQQLRTMSMLNPPPMMGFGTDAPYPPSVAPSERSNIGNPSRYKSVSNAKLGTDGGSTITSASQAPTNSNFLSATIHRGKKASSSPAADDDEDWSSHANRRHTRRSAFNG